MANVTTLKKGGSLGAPDGNTISTGVLHEIDIAAAVAAGLLTTEKVAVITIPADTFLEVLAIENVTALSLGAGARIDVGDSAADTTFVNNGATTTAGFDYTIALSPKKYVTADTLQLKVTGGTLTSGKIRFVLRMTQLSRVAPAVSGAL